MNPELGFLWVDEEDYAKAIGQFRLQVSAQLRVFSCYGMDMYIPHVVEAIVELAHDFGMRVRGEDRPIDTKHKPLMRPTE